MTNLMSTRSWSSKFPPPGVIAQLGMGTLPAGYLDCDGSAVSRTTYKNLFAAIGTTYGTGDGSTTFNVPDLRAVFLRSPGSQTVGGVSYSGGSLGAKVKDKTNNTGLSASTSSTNSATVGNSSSLAHTHSFSDRFLSVGNSAGSFDDQATPVITLATSYSNSEVGRTSGNPSVSLNHTHTPATLTVSSSTSLSSSDAETTPGSMTIKYGIKT